MKKYTPPRWNFEVLSFWDVGFSQHNLMVKYYHDIKGGVFFTTVQYFRGGGDVYFYNEHWLPLTRNTPETKLCLIINILSHFIDQPQSNSQKTSDKWSAEWLCAAGRSLYESNVSKWTRGFDSVSNFRFTVSSFNV